MYDELYEAWKRERANAEIQGLPRDFYARLTEYMKKLREESRMMDEKTIKAKLMRQEDKNVRKMVKSLLQLRYRKILRKVMAEKTLPMELLTEEEERMGGELLPLAESYNSFLKDMLQGRLARIERKREERKQMVVRFLQAVPAIIGSDMRPYGPFKSEDVATLPLENARILIRQGVAVEVETK